MQVVCCLRSDRVPHALGYNVVNCACTAAPLWYRAKRARMGACDVQKLCRACEGIDDVKPGVLYQPADAVFV